MNPIGNSTDESNLMSKYFIHSNQAETIQEQNNYINQINNQNSQMNSSFESIMTSQTNLNNEIMNDLIGVESPDKKIIKILRTFKKNIKLRNATIKKNFWKRDYINNSIINIKISNLFPIIQPSQGFCLCIYNYMNNKQFKELICKVENDIIINNSNNIYNIIEQYNMINQDENQMNNLLINPIAYLDNNKHRKELMKLIASIYPRLKSLRNELGKSKENYIFNYLVIKSKLINQKILIYGKLYSIFPNINFQLREIQKLSLSSKFKLNKLLISKRHTNIENEKGVLLTNGFITMSSEKRIITLTDDTNKKELQESQSLKQIIFGIWLSLKNEDVSNYENIEILINKHRHFIYRKCLEFILASPKIETIYSPSPDQGIFLLIIFFKTSQCYFEVKIVPNEEEKFFVNENEINNQNDILLEKFGNQWLIKTQKFDLNNNNGQFFFDFNGYRNQVKIDTADNFINKHLNKNNNSNNINIDNMNNFNKSSRNNYPNNNQFAMNTFPNSNMINNNYNQENNQFMMTDINNINNNYESTNNNFGYTSQGFKDSKGFNTKNNNMNNNIFRTSKSQKKIIDNNSFKNKEMFDPLTDIFDKNNSNNNSNNNMPTINNQKQNQMQNFSQSQSLYSSNNNININNNQENIEYNQNEYPQNNKNSNNKKNIDMNDNNNNKILNNIGNNYGDIGDDNWFNQSNFSKGLNFPYSNKPNANPQNMFGQIMMNNNINILNNINNNNNINNSNREELSQQSNTNYSQYTLGKKIHSNNCSINNSNNEIINKENEIINNINNNLNNNLNLNNNSNKNHAYINPSTNREIQNDNNNYVQYNKYITKYSTYNENIIKEEKSVQTDDINDDKEKLNQVQGLNNTIIEQSKSIQMLQNKVNNLEELLAKVNFLLRKKQQKEKEKENDLSNDNENEINENNNNIGELINKSESLKNSENNINNKNVFTILSQRNNNIQINNNSNNNIKNSINNEGIQKSNEEMSGDNLYKIKNISNSNFVDSNNKLIIAKNKGLLNNEESLDNELSSDLNVSDSRNSKELNKSNNVGDKTIEIPKIKYNSTLLNSNNDETENDISSN